MASLYGCNNNGTGTADLRSSEEDWTAQDTVATAVADEAPEPSRRGEILYLQCRACHSTDAAGGHLVGPNLSDLFGSTAGTKEDFVYSTSLADSSIVWSEETLDEFLAKPNDYFPGTKMAFVGLSDEDDRRVLIAYLKAQTNR